MIEFLKRVVFKNKKVNCDLKNNKEIISLIVSENIIEINIEQECTFNEYINYSDGKLNEYKIPIRLFIRDRSNLLQSKLKKQKFYIFDNNDYKYLIAKGEHEIKILGRKIIDNDIHEVALNLDMKDRNYQITKYIHDSYYSTKSFNSYSSCYDKFSLDKGEALFLAQDVLDNLNKVKINLNIRYVYRLLNLVPSENYLPIIKDNTITLSWPYCRYKTNINNEKNINFDIILNKTGEIIG